MNNRLLNELIYYGKPFKPLLALEIIKSSFAKKWRHLALTVDVSFGANCNMRCRHCSAATLGANGEQTLTHDDYQRLGHEFDRMRVLRLNITGGEPLLRPDFEQTLKALGPAKRHVKLQTNGLLLDRARIKSLKKMGVNAITISLDSLDADEYAAFRGVNRDSHGIILRNLDLVRQAGLQVSTSFVLTHQNLRSASVGAVIAFAEKKRYTLLANIATVAGRWQSRPDYLFDAEDRVYLQQLLKRHPHVRTDHDLTGCPAAVRKIYITPHGDVIPCPFIHVSFGNVRHEPLPVIRERMMTIYPFSGARICPAAEDKSYFEQWHQVISHSEKWPIPYQQLLARMEP
jgi:MoaA/NifB/PqqE/SkfB family radical SAM enzyme